MALPDDTHLSIPPVHDFCLEKCQGCPTQKLVTVGILWERRWERRRIVAQGIVIISAPDRSFQTGSNFPNPRFTPFPLEGLAILDLNVIHVIVWNLLKLIKAASRRPGEMH